MKRVLDLFLVIIFAPLWVPLLLVITILVRLKLGRPVFFHQRRPGSQGRIFEIIKFRTMTDAKDENGNLLPDAQRMTPFGNWLRATSLDELPELLNVLRGEMSLVGPRPLMVRYLPRYSAEQARRHDVLPGITGWAQINGRNAISWDKKFELDIWYVDHRSLWLDIKILFLTFKQVFLRKGINAAKDVPMPEFMGTGKEDDFRLPSEDEESESEKKEIVLGDWVGDCFYNPKIRVPMLILIYAFICGNSLLFAFLMRFDFLIPMEYADRMSVFLLWVVALELVVLYLFGQFRGLLSFFSVYDLKKLFLCMSTVMLLQLLIGLVVGEHFKLPRGVILANFVINFLLLAGFRLALRLVREKWFTMSGDKHVAIANFHQIRTAIIGAGDTGAQLAQELLSKPRRGLFPVIFVDDNVSKHGATVHGIPVLGPTSDLKKILKEEEIEKAVIAMPTASPAKVKQIVDLLSQVGVEYVTVPGIGELLSGEAKLTALRPVEIKDILGRDGVDIALEDLRSLICGKLILVTGSGGSIGSELCRQILRLDPLKLLMVEQSEGNLFQIEQEMVKAGYKKRFYPIIADVCDENRMASILEGFQPQIIFHAAAHKHVPMMEAQPGEALKNNSWGTLNLARLAVRFKVQKFVLISTDKAIRPTNVMGASKRLGEMILQEMQQKIGTQNGTRFISVRFGNVLGSSGSVVPTFEKQIANGGPITVTHPDITRYFMAIPEAVGLVLQAATLGEGGDILMLDMGKPVKIVDLARQMIALHGLVPGEDIEIKFTGLRPGEKLYEELNYEFEHSQATKHPKILRLNSQEKIDSWKFHSQLNELWSVIEAGNIERIKKELNEIVKEYKPSF